MEKKDIKSLSMEEMKTELKILGEPSFRAGQIYRWLHQRGCLSFDEMSDLSLSLRQKLEEVFYINRLSVKRRQESALDGTVKFLFELLDHNCIETVFMRYHHGNSLCISTQVGCRMGCGFCASTLGGLVRCLTPSEMLDEVYEAERQMGEKISSIVLMGIGEPLDNFDNVLRFLNLLSSEQGRNLSLRHVSLSTCGLVDKIYELMKYKLGLTLSVSLHAPNNEIRSQMMPVNRKYPIEALLKACRDYFDATGRRISFEYALVDSVNDSEACALELCERLKDFGCHVNLIPINAVKERAYRRSKQEKIQRFQKILEEHHITATVRRELGSDISAACGQLRREAAQQP